MSRPTGSTRVAAIDCGTNSIRLLIADVGPTGLHDVARRMEIVRLGQDVDRTGRFAVEAIERTRLALARYTAELRAAGAERVRMVATSATRDVANRDAFLDMVVATLGQRPDVITGEEEARLSFAGATRDLPDLPAPYLVLDIGGGSTEFVLGSSTVDSVVSVDVGCVRLTERHLHSDPPTAAEVAAAVHDIEQGVARAGETVGVREAGSLVGVAGTVTTVVALALRLPAYDAQRIHHARVSYDQVEDVTRTLVRATRDERAAMPAVHPGRVDVIGAGALILATVMRRIGAGSVVASEHDILDGIAYQLA